MDTHQYFDILINKLPPINDQSILHTLENHCEVIRLEKGEPLTAFQSNNRKIYCSYREALSGNIITSRGGGKTVMFHTESFCEFFKSYD
ncbi:hypothetical protein HX126_03165 [Chryseobacterium indologenes]|uniref:hypothetical protein n=1 Tax=Chryseobacterium indologenes TaxID=253 RepID=UPI002579217B|nr:hypothetical protein [Chryseobacterium indologenes]MDM1553554.1 hypothetical protein [Chryseobacterium indologenes]